MERILECIPNFSEGRNKGIIAQIEAGIARFKGVKLLHTDMGYDANRTVITFAGYPEAVCEAAFEAVKIASALIDMRTHKGTHPRIGATDVLPLVPVAGIGMDEAVKLSWQLSERVGQELQIPVFNYECSAKNEYNKKLENIRKGNYEALVTRIEKKLLLPDYGPHALNPKAGATVIGARKFLIAYNVNLNTQLVEVAKQIASEVRESGQSAVISGIRIQRPGLLKAVKAIGWYVDEYKKAQVSMNLTDFEISPLHEAFLTVKKIATKLGVEVSGSELIGMVPLEALIEAGKYFAGIQKHSEQYFIETAISALGLSEFSKFVPSERILEYKLGNMGE